MGVGEHTNIVRVDHGYQFVHWHIDILAIAIGAQQHRRCLCYRTKPVEQNEERFPIRHTNI